MKKQLSLIAVVALVGAACEGPQGAAGPSALVSVQDEAPGAHCSTGGVSIRTGLDTDGDGVLSDAEVQDTSYVCRGEDGTAGHDSLVSVTDEPAGDACPAGGERIDIGTDADGSGTLDAAEIETTRYVCDGADGADGAPGTTSLVAVTAEPAGPNCPSGGQKIESGLDADGSGVLDAAEVDTTRYVCNGLDGANGADGAVSLVAVTYEPAGASCAAGGKKIESGVDTSGDGSLDPSEVDATAYVCNGVDGANGADGATSLVSVTAEPAGASCANGGRRIDTGVDTSGDGVLDPSEIDATSYVCNGTDGVDGTNGADGADALVVTGPEPASGHCLRGGQKIETGLDADRSGTLDATEIADTAYVCNGVAPRTPARILCFTDGGDPWTAAAQRIGVPAGNVSVTSDPAAFATQYDGGGWDVVIVTYAYYYMDSGVKARVLDRIAGGRKLILSYFDLDAAPDLKSALGLTTTSLSTAPSVWPAALAPVDLFGFVEQVPQPLVLGGSFLDNGDELLLSGGGQALAVDGAGAGMVTATGAGPNITAGFLFAAASPADLDADGVDDLVELAENLLAL